MQHSIHLAIVLTFALSFSVRGDESPLAPGSTLVPIEGEFELADGPAWDGWSLTIPDPFAEKAKRFVPSKNEWSPSLSGKRLSGSFYNH